MKRILPAAALATIALAIAPAAHAQELIVGTWTGQVIPPDGEVFEVEYEVQIVDDVLTIALIPPPDAGAPLDRFEFNEVSLEEDGSLTFWWEPETRLDCVLEPEEDGSYEGACTDEGGESGILIMEPPGDED